MLKGGYFAPYSTQTPRNQMVTNFKNTLVFYTVAHIFCAKGSYNVKIWCNYFTISQNHYAHLFLKKRCKVRQIMVAPEKKGC